MSSDPEASGPQGAPTVARPSVASLLLSLSARGQQLGTGTGFIVEQDGLPYLVTNRHVLSGRGEDNQPRLRSGAVPDSVCIIHNVEGQLGIRREVVEPLHDESGLPKWFEHPTLSRKVDVVALPLTQTAGVAIYAYRHVLEPNEVHPVVGVADDVSIVGFPFGMTAGAALGVWSRGTVASEMSIDAFDGLPTFLVDSRTRPGQSGSPVIFYSGGGWVNMSNGSQAVATGPIERLLGVYSGRINEQSDLGIVWRSKVIQEIIAGGRRLPPFP